MSRTSAGRARKNWRRMLTRFEAPADELVVQVGFQADGVVAEDHGVDVVAERDGGITEFADPVLGRSATG